MPSENLHEGKLLTKNEKFEVEKPTLEKNFGAQLKC